MAQTFSGFNVPQKWNPRGNYQAGQGGQLVTHALITWRAIRPRNGTPPGTISGQWEQVPATITSPTQAPAPTPAPKPTPPAPKVVVIGTSPVSVNNNNVSVAVFQPSGDNAFQGLVPAPPAIAGTALFLREDGTWAAAGGGGGGTVTSVALALPAEFTVSGSPVIAAGTLTGAWASETNNLVFAGPAVVPGTPTFRSLVFADLPAGVGTVTSVGVSTDASYLTVAASPVTTTGTITVNKTTGLAANQFVATPSGAPGTADLRVIVPADLAGTPGAGKYWDGAGSGAWTTLPAPGTGTVTSIALTVPSFLSVSGSPVTTSGTFAVTLATETANTVFSGPTSGGAATPTFRPLVTADLPAGTGTVTSVALSMPSILTVSGSPVTTAGTLTAVLATQSANTIFAGPTSGAAATPAFRVVDTADLGTGTADSTKFLRGDLTWQPTVNIVTAGIVSADFSTQVLLSFPNGDSYDVPGAIGANHVGITGVAATDIITDTGHGYTNGDRVLFSAITGGAGLTIDTQYYIIASAANTYQLSTTVGGAAFNFTTNITAGTIRSVGSIFVSVGASDPRTYAVMAAANYIYNTASIARNLAFAVVLGSNVNAAPGNSGILFPLNYASNATTAVLGHLDPGNTGSSTTQIFQLSLIGRFTLPAGAQTVKLVAAARNITATATFDQRDLVIMATA